MCCIVIATHSHKNTNEFAVSHLSSKAHKQTSSLRFAIKHIPLALVPHCAHIHKGLHFILTKLYLIVTHFSYFQSKEMSVNRFTAVSSVLRNLIYYHIPLPQIKELTICKH